MTPRHHSVLFACLLLAGALPAAAVPSKPAVEVQRVDANGERTYEVTASAAVLAPPATAFKVLTDYERLPEFVPDMRSVRVLSRSGNKVLVEQSGEAHFLFVRREIRMTVEVTEQQPGQIDSALVSGDMRVYRCRWQLAPDAATGGTRIAYSAQLAPGFYVPGFLGTNLIRADIEKMLAAVLARIERQP
jgi:ribosome-associated toxin RatA of RatAB toxin-antitoxin module